MRLSSIFVAFLFAPLTLSAQSSSTLYSPPRPTQACPVSVAAHRIAGTATVQTDTPASTEEEKQMRARVLDIKQQIDALKDQKANLQAMLGKSPDTASADLQRQLNEIAAQIKEKEMEANQLTIKLTLEQAKRSAADGYAPALGLDLSIAGTLRPIATVDIIVHGFSNRGQLMPASQIPNAAVDSPSRVSVGPSNLDRNRSGSGGPIGIEPTESFHLSRDDSGSAIRASIAARGMTGIAWLEVTRIEFADGSTWLPASHDECRFAPSLYVPVAASPR